MNIGANYDPDLCVKALHEGLNAVRLIMTVLGELLNAPRDSRERFIEAIREADRASHLEMERREARIGASRTEP
jgi:hypothetical protein